jgi:hypothetical protein
LADLGVSMATVAGGSAGVGPAPLVSRPDEGHDDPGRSTEIVEQAKLQLSARYGLLPDEAFEVVCGLARSQRCSIEEFAESVVRSGGRLDGDLRAVPRGSLVAGRNGTKAASLSPELLIETPSAASAIVLAGLLSDYAARAVVEQGVWRVVVDRCSSCSEQAPGALSRTRQWLATCGLSTARVTLNGETYLLEGSANGVSR